MVKVNKYELTNDKIIIHPNRQIKVLVYTLFWVFQILCISTFAWIEYEMGEKVEVDAAMLYMIGFLILMLLPFIPLIYRKIIFDFKERKVSINTAFFKMKEYAFNEIEAIKPVSGDSIYYAIFLKSDKLGKGIRFSPHYTATKQHDKELNEFEIDIIEKVDTELTKKETTTIADIPLGKNFHFFRQRGAEFTNQQYHFFLRFFGIATLIGVFFFQYAMWGDNSGEGIIARIMICIFPFPFLLSGNDKVVFDTHKATLTLSSWFGILKSQYNLNNFSGFQTIRNSVYFVYTGTELSMYFNENNNDVKVNLVDFRNTKKLSEYHEEVVEIMKKTFPDNFNENTNHSNSLTI